MQKRISDTSTLYELPWSWRVTAVLWAAVYDFIMKLLVYRTEPIYIEQNQIYIDRNKFIQYEKIYINRTKQKHIELNKYRLNEIKHI